MQLIESSSTKIVWAYSVNKQRGGKNQQSMAEAVANLVKSNGDCSAMPRTATSASHREELSATVPFSHVLPGQKETTGKLIVDKTPQIQL